MGERSRLRCTTLQKKPDMIWGANDVSGRKSRWHGKAKDIDRKRAVAGRRRATLQRASRAVDLYASADGRGW